MAATSATVMTSREAGIIIVEWRSGEKATDMREEFEKALKGFGGVTTDAAVSGHRLFVFIDRDLLDNLPPDDRERTWVGLREQVGTTVKKLFGG